MEKERHKKEKKIGWLFLSLIPLGIVPVLANQTVEPVRSFFRQIHQVETRETPDKIRLERKSWETRDVDERGRATRQVFDPQGRRAAKEISDYQGRPLERWVFDPKKEWKIRRYEIYNYKGGELTRYRIARWRYDEAGGFVKTNRVYDANHKLVQLLYEHVSAKGKKFREEWRDAQGRLSAMKLWDPETGEFKIHYLVKERFSKGLEMRQYLDQEGRVIAMGLYTESGKPIKPALQPGAGGWNGLSLPGSMMRSEN